MPIPTNGYITFVKDELNDTNKEMEGSWWHISNYQIVKKKGKFPMFIAEEIQRFEKIILYFGFDFFFVNISCIPTKSPHEGYLMIL